MASTRNLQHDFILTPQQQNLLYAALNSNRAASNQATGALGLSPMSFNASPPQGLNSLSSFQNSPELDYDYDFTGADSSFDYSIDNIGQAKMIGDLPGSSTKARSESADNETSDKRSHPDDDEEETNGAKRRESEDKVAKKPGRKPLTTEPSSKRKAQNRAAQRAFRERKEKHLKDLETKVEELEQASQAANHENERLRAKVERMTAELAEYKKRVSNFPTSARGSGPAGPFGASLTRGINDVNFQFEFPKFGLPGASSTAHAKPSPPSKQGSQDQLSPTEKSSASKTTSLSNGTQNTYSGDSLNFSGLFSDRLTNQNVAQASRANSDSQFSITGAMSTSSPSASSNSNMGASSSCGTSPEPITQSPMGFKPLDSLTTIGEEQSNLGHQDFDQFSALSMPDFNWLPQNFEFDPQLFGDYREPQENILTNGLDDSFFNDAFDVDFTTPYNLPLAAPKKGLIAQIDAAKEADEPATPGQFLTCNKIWETLQNCPKVQNGDFDLDGLCSDLQKKAKCSGSGAVVDEQDFQAVMKKYLGNKSNDADIKSCSESIIKS